MLRKPKVVLGATYCDYSHDYSDTVLKYVEEADNCNTVKDDFITTILNGNTGVLTIVTDTTNLPNMNLPIVYYVYIDGEEYSELTVVNSNLDFQTQLTPVNRRGQLASYDILVIAASEDNSKGCKFEFVTSPITSDNYKLVQNGNTYSIELNAELNEYTTMNLSEFNITWGIRNGSVLVDEVDTSITISTASLYSITSSSTVVLYTKFGDITLYTEEIAIPESEIEVDISLSNSLEGTTFYTDIHTTVTEGNNTVYTYVYLDNQRIETTRVPTVGNVGKQVTVVLTLEEDSVGDVFNELNTSKYFTHKRVTITDEYELDMTFPMNALVDRRMVSSQNPNRSLEVFLYDTPTDFSKAVSYVQPVELANTYDSTDVIKAFTTSGAVPATREGLIIDGEYFDAINKVGVVGLRVYDESLELQPVTRAYLVNKKVEEENKLNTLIFSSVTDFADFGFTGDTSNFYAISDKYIGFNTDDSSVISKEFNSNHTLNGVQFELEYGHIPDTISVFIVVRIYNTNGTLHSTYGFEKIEDGKMKVTDAKANVLVSIIDSGSEYISKSFANIYDIGRLDIQVSGGQSAQLIIRNLYIDVVEGD